MGKPDSAFRPLVRVLAAWGWLGVYVVLTLLLATLMSSHRFVAPTQTLLDSPGAWTSSSAMTVERDDPGLRFRGSEPGVAIASRIVRPPEKAEFLNLRACFGTAFEPGSVFVAAASITRGTLDFNRPYRLRSDDGGEAGTCLSEHLPRRRDDEAAVVQVQLRDAAGSLGLAVLEIEFLAEQSAWLLTRSLMLAAGIGLLALRFRSYAVSAPAPGPSRFAGYLGVAVVAGIVFGCCVSATLKAEIFALMTGGRSLIAAQSEESLLRVVFPTGGFAVFTILHAVLFALAAFFLGLNRPQSAWLDLLLLGLATETLQHYVPGRGPGISDMLVDWAGVGAGSALLFLLRCRQGKRLLL